MERDYVEHRSAVLAMLRADFPRLADPEELYQEAWAELLELRSRGEPVRNVRGLLKTVAWRRAADTVRKRRPDAIDPTNALVTEEADTDPLPDQVAQVRLDAAALRMVVDSLDERQAAVLKLRFDLELSAKEIATQLGVSPKRLEKIVTEAYRLVAEQLSEDESNESPWMRRQRSLLLACETGIASARQRRRAQEMVDRDPRCRAMLREMRIALRGVAVVLPMPVLDRPRDLRRVEVLLARLQDVLPNWARPSGGGTSLRDLSLTSSAEHVGAGTGVLAGAGVVAKVIGACAVIGGSAALCLSVGAKHPVAPKPGPQRTVQTTARAQVRTPVTTPTISTPSTTSSKSPRTKTKTHASTASHKTVSTSSPASTSSPSPVAKGTTEFGTGGTGSSATPATPAAAPKDGGGEFGP